MKDGKIISRARSEAEAGAANKVYVAVGAGTKPIAVDWRRGDTVARALKRAEVTVAAGMTPTLGKVRVVDPDHTAVSAGDTIVVAGRPANG